MKNSASIDMSRRRFLGQSACAGVTSAPLLSTLLNLKMTGNAAAQGTPNDYKALVCLFFGGGNDSFNMLVPRGPTEYGEYRSARSDLALPSSGANAILPINGTHNQKTFGVHPGMSEVQALFNNNKLAFVSNVGTLVEPTTMANINTAKLPLGLYSHADQIMHWQTSVPDRRSRLGWGGRVGDILSASNSNQRISMNISLAGTNVFQTGTQTVSYEIDPSPTGNGSIRLGGYGDEENPAVSAIGRAAINSLIDVQYQNLFQQTFANITRNALDIGVEFSNAVGAQTISTPFASNEISQSFQMIARTIAARQTLGMRRQTFFVLFGGFDHHDEVLNNQAAMLPIVSRAMSEFDTALTSIGMNNNVTTFTASDFGRTLTSNGKGSDHAWGGNHMVMGGAVRGGQVYGSYPSLALGSNLDTGRGRLIPTLSTDEYFAELAMWFGIPVGRLDEVFPNLSRFHTGSDYPVGFMA